MSKAVKGARRKQAVAELNRVMLELRRNGYEYCATLHGAVGDRHRENARLGKYDGYIEALTWGINEAKKLIAQIEANRRINSASGEYDDIMSAQEIMDGVQS